MKSHPIHFRVSGSEHGQPLLEVLGKRLSVSNRQAKLLLDAHNVFVNGRRIWMARHPLAIGDRLEVHPLATSAPAISAKIPILYQDEDYMLVDKPAGLLANGPDSAEAALRRQTGLGRLEAVHRIDRETSGCLLLALHPAARDVILPLFEQREMEKVYQVLVLGQVPRGLRTIREPIDGESAVSHIAIIAARPQASWLEVRIETGRTHQIRKHLSGAGYPVLGDKTYGTREIPDPALRQVPRQLLHAGRLAFKHPRTGARVEAVAWPPQDFKQWAARLGLKRHPRPQAQPTPGGAAAGRSP